MQEAPIPENEEERLKSLQNLNILDTATEERFDRITRIAKKLLDVEIVLVSLVDSERQWFKSKVGLEAIETPRDISFCGHAIMSDKIFVINDASKDKRFHDNPLVTENPNIRLYAGKPLNGPDTEKIGTLCAIDSNAREFSEDEKQILEDLAVWVELELNCQKLSLTLDSLKTKNAELSRLNKTMIDRELKMRDLKTHIKQLEEKLSTISGE